MRFCIVTVVLHPVSIQSLAGVPLDVHSVAVGSGYLGAALGVGMVVPQIVRIRQNPAMPGVSVLSWSLTALSCLTWLLYGVRGGVLPQIPGNVLIVSGAVLVALTAPSVVDAGARAAGIGLPAVGLVAAATVLPPQAIAYLAFGIGLAAALPQTLTSFARAGADESAVSIPAWLMRAGSQAAWLLYAILLSDVAVAVAASVTLASALLLLAIESRRPARRAVLVRA